MSIQLYNLPNIEQEEPRFEKRRHAKQEAVFKKSIGK
jgi:hypothetical protein